MTNRINIRLFLTTSLFMGVVIARQVGPFFNIMEKEIWRDIPGYEGLYKISNYGKIKSLKKRGSHKELIMKFGKIKCGYYIVGLHKNNKRKCFLVSRIVAKVFIPNPDTNKYPQVNHINGIKTDNRAVNLEWCNNSQNIKHAFKLGLAKGLKGEKGPNSKLTNDQVREIRRLKGLIIQRKVAVMFGVSTVTIGEIQRGQTWRHI